MVLPGTVSDQEDVKKYEHVDDQVGYKKYLINVASDEHEIDVEPEMILLVTFIHAHKKSEDAVKLVHIEEDQALRLHVVAGAGDQLPRVELVRMPVLQISV